MTQSAVSTILPAARPTLTPAVIYLPEIHSKGCCYFPELGTGDTTKASVVADIASAQHDEIVRVIAIDLAAGKCWDASKEIAQAVLDITAAECSEAPSWCVEFLETHLTINTVQNAFVRAA